MKIDRDEKQTIIDYQQTFGTEAGKRVLRDLMNQIKFDVTHVPLYKTHPMYLDNNGNVDTHKLVSASRQRDIIIYIYAKLAKDPYEVKQSKAINIERKEDG